MRARIHGYARGAANTRDRPARDRHHAAVLAPATARTMGAARRLSPAPAAIAIVIATASATAVGAPAPSRVHVTADLVFTAAEASACPGEGPLRDEIARRIGYDPFTPADSAARFGRVRVDVARTPSGLRATYARDDAAGAPQWTRTYEVPGAGRASCDVLISGLGSLIAVSISTFARRAPDPVKAPVPEKAPDPPAPPARPRFEAAAAAFVAAGTAPRANLGGALHLGVRAYPFADDRAHLSFSVEARVDAPGARDDGLRTRLAAGSFIACAHRAIGASSPALWVPFGCAVGTAGAIRGGFRDHPEIAVPARAFAAAGIRAGVEARLSPRLAVRAQGEVAATLRAPATPLQGAQNEAGRAGGTGGVAAVIAF